MKHTTCALALTLAMTAGAPWGWAQCHADLNGNQTIDNDDLLLLLADYGQTCEVAAWDDPVISEIHYNPSTQQGSDSDFEFVELMNPHPFAIDVGGWSLGDGIDATIPAGTTIEAHGFLLTANDTATYALLVPLWASYLDGDLQLAQQRRNHSLDPSRRNTGGHCHLQRHRRMDQRSRRCRRSLEWKGPGMTMPS